jgi:cytosine/adenosine deaminase-related metal-dependent hydrolase
MNKFLLIPGKIITVNASNEILYDYALEIEDNVIRRLARVTDFHTSDYSDVYRFPDLVLIPGFIQTHIHLCQTLFRG